MVTIYKSAVQLAWRKGSMGTGSLFALMVLAAGGGEAMGHSNGTDYGRHKFWELFSKSQC